MKFIFLTVDIGLILCFAGKPIYIISFLIMSLCIIIQWEDAKRAELAAERPRALLRFAILQRGATLKKYSDKYVDVGLKVLAMA